MTRAHPVEIERREHADPLREPEARAVGALLREAETHDGGPALSEQFLLSVRSGHLPQAPGVTHLLARAADGSLAGYAQVRAGAAAEPPSAELVVAPASRRAGVGGALLAALPADVRVWSHLPGAAGQGAAAFAAASSLRSVRSLHVMGRSLVAPPFWPAAQVPDDLVVRTFEPGRDDEAWLTVNSAAFAHHPEQGALTRADLRERMRQPWFDANGFLLVCPRESPEVIAAFHWTKVDPPEGDVGEVYVVGVAPDHQGSGLGRAATVLGLNHLRDAGLREVVLYMDEDNVAAVHTYSRLGFHDLQVHRQFAGATVGDTPEPG